MSASAETMNDVPGIVRPDPGAAVQHLSEVGSTKPGCSEFDIITVGLDVLHRAGPEQAARDLLRRCRPGGRIELACPTPGSFLARVQQTIDHYIPKTKFAAEPGFVGTREILNIHFGDCASALGAIDRVIKLYHSSPEHWLALWQTSYAPLKRAFRQVDPDWRGQFSDDLIRLAKQFTDVDAAGRFIRCEYLEFLVHKSDLQ